MSLICGPPLEILSQDGGGGSCAAAGAPLLFVLTKVGAGFAHLQEQLPFRASNSHQ